MGAEHYGTAHKCNHLVSACEPALNPTPISISTSFIDDDEKTVITSNSLRHRHAICGNFSNLEKYPEPLRHQHATQQVHQSMALTARTLFGHPMPQYLNALTIATNQAIADTGATSIFIMEGADVDNKRPATLPLTINLPDGKQIRSTHVCDIQIPGLPTMLLGHIVPSLSIASLIGIWPLCQVGCKVIFDDK